MEWRTRWMFSGNHAEQLVKWASHDGSFTKGEFLSSYAVTFFRKEMPRTLDSWFSWLWNELAGSIRLLKGQSPLTSYNIGGCHHQIVVLAYLVLFIQFYSVFCRHLDTCSLGYTYPWLDVYATSKLDDQLITAKMILLTVWCSLQYLDENKKLILAILDNQNLGKLAECAQ